jgi:hippurate hydrolase
VTDEAGIEALEPWMRGIRHDLHAHPELAFEEVATADRVAQELERMGIDFVRGIGGTGVVASIRGEPGGGSIGLRADMDALPMEEANSFAHRSRHPGKFHGCGHDGHTTMLLGAARVLADQRRFRGTVHLIFQPAEESAGGARAMLDGGLLERFPMSAVYGLHNSPLLPVGAFATRAGPMLAAVRRFDIMVRGRSGHGAFPHLAVDPIVVAAGLVQSLQSIVSRRLDPLAPAVLTISKLHAGDTYNVIPESALLGGAIRYFEPAVGERLQEEIRRIAAGVALAHDAAIDITFANDYYPPLVNTGRESLIALEAATRAAGGVAAQADAPMLMGSEDFAWMLQSIPGCFMAIGNGDGPDSCMVHNANYDFNDSILTTGVRYWVELVRLALPLKASATGS